MKDTPDDPKGKEIEVETKELEILHPYDGETLMVIKEANGCGIIFFTRKVLLMDKHARSSLIEVVLKT